MKKIKLPTHSKAYFKIVHNKGAAFTLCILYDNKKRSFKSGVSLVDPKERHIINLTLGKSIALRRALSGKNYIIKRFPRMTFTGKSGDLHFQHINPSISYSLRVTNHWNDAKKALQDFYKEIQLQVKLDNTTIKNAKNHITIPVI